MNVFAVPDWHAVFVPATPLVAIRRRGTLVYLALFGLPRFVLRRQSGAMG